MFNDPHVSRLEYTLILSSQLKILRPTKVTCVFYCPRKTRIFVIKSGDVRFAV
jgi:hypothetical protein